MHSNTMDFIFRILPVWILLLVLLWQLFRYIYRRSTRDKDANPPWVEAIDTGMQARPFFIVLAMFLYFMIYTSIFFMVFVTLHKITLGAALCAGGLYILGGFFVMTRAANRVSFKVFGKRYTGVCAAIKGVCMVKGWPATLKGMMVVAPQGIVYSPGITWFDFSWAVYPMDEIVSIAVDYRGWAIFRKLHLAVKLQDGTTLLWETATGNLPKYLRKNKYPVAETTGNQRPAPGAYSDA